MVHGFFVPQAHWASIHYLHPSPPLKVHSGDPFPKSKPPEYKHHIPYTPLLSLGLFRIVLKKEDTEKDPYNAPDLIIIHMNNLIIIHTNIF